VLAEATGIDVDSRRVLLDHGAIEYDTLIIATGSRHHYFGLIIVVVNCNDLAD
jgi:NADH dehydrogenase